MGGKLGDGEWEVEGWGLRSGRWGRLGDGEGEVQGWRMRSGRCEEDCRVGKRRFKGEH